MAKYPRLQFTKPKRTTRRKKSRQSEPVRTAPATPDLLSPIQDDLAELKEAIQASTRQLRATTRPDIATDGKTQIPPEVKRRGEIVEIVGNQKLMRDKTTGIEWIERLY